MSKKLFSFLGTLGCATAIALPAAAADFWSSNGTCAKAVAGSYILGCESHPNGRPVKTTSGASVGGGAGTSIDVSNDGFLWVANNNHQIFKWTGSIWQEFTNYTRCEGGTLTIRQSVGDTSLAVGTGNNIFVIAGDGADAWGNNIRRFTGTCWQTMAAGKAREISIYSGNTPWVANNADQLFIWNGSSWGSAIPNGLGKSVARNGWVTGSDNASIWQWTGSTWVQETSWFGGFVSYVREVSRCGGWAIGSNSTLNYGDCVH